MTTRPRTLAVQPEHIPAELKALRQWVVWRYENREGKWTKPPLNPRASGRYAKATDPATWGTYQHALRSANSTDERTDGIGFVLTTADPFTVIDIDHCADPDTGELTPEAQEIVRALASYTEFSPSGTGVHIFIRAALRPGMSNRKDGIEIYTTGRFLTITGHRVPDTVATIEERQDALDALHARLFPVPPIPSPTALHSEASEAAPPVPSPIPPVIDDPALIERARGATNGAKFSRLWDGDSRDYDGDESRGDLALCGMLAFWTGGDAARIDRLFRQSGRMREKWNRPDYRERTIAAALAGKTDFYAPGVTPIRSPASPSAPSRAKTTPNRAGTVPRGTLGTPDGIHHQRLNDVANGHRFAVQHGTDLRYCHPLKTWFFWDGKRWRRDATGEVIRRAKQSAASIYHEAAEAPETVREDVAKWARRSHAKERLDAMVALAQSEKGVFIAPGDLDADPWLLTCLNGTINLRTGLLQPHCREDLITKICPVPYELNATLPLWDAVLTTITGGDAAYRGFLQRAAGYSLTGDTGEEVLFFAHGPAATGKSTFIEALKTTLGEYATTADFEAFLSRSSVGAPRNDIARLAGARFVASIEVDEGKKLAEGLVKMLTGGDTVTARFLYQEAFEFKPAFKLWLAANHAPQVRDDDEAMWRRILRLPFTQVVPKAERKKEVKAALCDLAVAGPAILTWMVQGCLAWQAEGLGVPQAVDEATAQYRMEMDPLSDFIADCCVLDRDAHVSAADLWKAYQDYSRANGEDWPVARKEFAERLERRGCISGKSMNTRLWKGIGLLTNQPDLTETDTDFTQRRDARDARDATLVKVRSEVPRGGDFTKNASLASLASLSRVSVPESANPPPLPEGATGYQKTVHARLTNDLRAFLSRGGDTPASFSLAKDITDLGFVAEEGESTHALALEWFGLSEPEGGKADAT